MNPKSTYYFSIILTILLFSSCSKSPLCWGDDINKGEIITDKNMRSIRPGFGLAPKHYDEIVGKKVNKDIKHGTPVKIDDIMGNQ